MVELAIPPPPPPRNVDRVRLTAMTTKQEWCGRGWRATARTGGTIASQPELLALRIRTAKTVYPWFAGPTPFDQGRLSQQCIPCGDSAHKSIIGASWGRSGAGAGLRGDALVAACCPPGKHVHSPDAVFLRRKLSFVHADSGLELHFAPEDVVRGCMFDAVGADLAPASAMPRRVQVRHAEKWRAGPVEESERQGIREVHYANDWTFSTRWWGCPVLQNAALEGVEDPAGELPMDLLTARDRILWYQEVEQYFDDLGDEGNVTYTVRARVMPGFFFVLARLELRVLNVVARQVDTRWLHVFGSHELMREWSWRELPPAKLRLRAQAGEVPGPALLRPADTQHRVFHRFHMP